MTPTTTPHHTAPRPIRSIPDDAPCTAFAPAPVGAYRRGFEDRTYDHAWFCPYAPGSAYAGPPCPTCRGTGTIEDAVELVTALAALGILTRLEQVERTAGPQPATTGRGEVPTTRNPAG